MNPTPEVVSSPSTTQPWGVLVVIGLAAVLFVIGLITGQVRLTSSKTRQSVRRGVLTIDAVLSTSERQAAIEYIRDEEYLVETDQERKDGNDDDEDELMSFQEHRKDDNEPD